MSGFTFSSYGRLLDELIALGYSVIRVKDHVEGIRKEPFVILRHDLEWGVDRALAVARIERDRSVCGTYYFHGPHRERVFQPDAMRVIAGMGHEVGYHYETLDLCGGDFELAERLFSEQLDEFRRSGVQVDTVCMHGNPRIQKRGYSRNADLFDDRLDVLTDQYGLLGEAYFLEDTASLEYISDVGIRFGGGWGESVSGLIDQLKQRRPDKICLVTHPDYWSASRLRAAGLYWAGRLLRGSRLNKAVSAVRSLVRNR